MSADDMRDTEKAADVIRVASEPTSMTGCADTQSSFPLYDDALQALFSFFFRDELKQLAQVSRMWRRVADTDHSVRLARFRALKRQVATDVANLDALEAMLIEDAPDTCPMETTNAALVRCRYIVYTMGKTPIDSLLQRSKLTNRMIHLLHHPLATIRMNAAWCVTNIAATQFSEHTDVLLRHGVVPRLMTLVRDEHEAESVRDQAVWALANIAADGPSGRDALLKDDGLHAILDVCIGAKTSLPLRRQACWLLKNILSRKPHLPFALTQCTVPILYQLLNTFHDVEVLDACLIALSVVSDHKTALPPIVASGVVPRLLQLLHHTSEHITLRALRPCGNIVAGDSLSTQCMIDADFIPELVRLLQHSNANIRDEAAWALSNIAAGNACQLCTLLSHPGFWKLVLTTLTNDTDLRTRKNLLHLVDNVVYKAPEECKTMVDAGAVEAIGSALGMNNGDEMDRVALNVLDAMMSHNSTIEKLQEHSKIMQSILHLREHPDLCVASLAGAIAEKASYHASRPC
jgi:hypothetical protein